MTVALRPYDQAPIALDYIARTSPRFLVVVDSDAVISSVDNLVRTGRPPYMLRLSRWGTGRLFASAHLYEEIYRRLPRVARRGVAYGELRDAFEGAFLPHLRFVDMAGCPSLADDQVLEVMGADTTDVPTALLAKMLAPAVVLSGDKHLRDPGIAPAQWRLVAGAAVRVGETDQTMVGGVMLTALPGVGVVVGVNAIATRLDVSPWLVGGLAVTAVAVGGYAALAPAERRRRLIDRLRPTGRAIVEMVAALASTQLENIAVVAEASVHPSDSPQLLNIAAVTVARAHRPIGTPEVHRVLSSVEGLDGLTLADVRTRLRATGAFVEGSPGRWQLGRARASLVAIVE